MHDQADTLAATLNAITIIPFVRAVRALDDALQYATDLSKHSLLALAQAVNAEASFAKRLRKALDTAQPQTAPAE